MADATIERHAEAVEEELAALVATLTPRAPLEPWPSDRPESERPRDAREVYDRVLAAIGHIPQSELEVLPELHPLDPFVIDEAAVEALFVRHGDLFAELEEARFADHMSANPALVRGKDNATNVVGWQTLTWLLDGRVRHALVEGKPKDAARAIQQQLLGGSDLATGFGAINVLVGRGIAGRALEHLRLLLAQDGPDAATLEGLAEDLKTPAVSPRSLEEILRVELIFARQALVDLALGRSEIEYSFSGEVGLRHVGSTRLFAAETLEVMSHQERLLEGLGDLSWRKKILRLTVADEMPRDPVEAAVHMTRTVWPRIARRMAHEAMGRNLAEVAIALRRYRLDHGAWPPTLDALVPSYLDTLEACPLTGLPLGYADGKVWSGGGDFDDDGGRPVDPDGEPDADGDVIWDLNDKTIPDPFEDLR